MSTRTGPSLFHDVNMSNDATGKPLKSALGPLFSDEKAIHFAFTVTE